MTRGRSNRWGLAVLTGFVVASLGGASALASVAARETSRRITVTGTKLRASNDVGNASDPAIGKTAPTISGTGLDGTKVTFAGNGKPRAVVFLAHWCPHCQREVPLIVKLAKQHKVGGIEVDTVTTNTNKNYPNYPPSTWLKREHWPFNPVLADDTSSRALVAFGGTGFPFFVLIGADNVVVARFDGEVAGPDITYAAQHLAAGTSPFRSTG